LFVWFISRIEERSHSSWDCLCLPFVIVFHTAFAAEIANWESLVVKTRECFLAFLAAQNIIIFSSKFFAGAYLFG
jgi:hypothetical protein